MDKDFQFKIRQVEEDDVPHLIRLTKKLAEYEKLLAVYTATEELYRKHGFGEEQFYKALLVENMNKEETRYVGMAIYFFTFSTFTGKPTLYLEDVFVLEEYRRRGIGTRLLVELAKIAIDKDCGRMEWSVLDWNEPTIKFCESLGAVPMDEWTVYRLTVPDIKRLAEKTV